MALGYYPFRVRRRVSWSPDRNKYPPENSCRIELLIHVLENAPVLLARLVGLHDPDARRDCVAGVVNGSVVCPLGAKRRDLGLELIDLVQQFGQPLGSLGGGAFQIPLRRPRASRSCAQASRVGTAAHFCWGS
jgi:hypothetical protein